VFPKGSRVLRRPVRDEMRLTVNLSAARDGDRIAMVAKSNI